jgi:hypothetical protein
VNFYAEQKSRSIYPSLYYQTRVQSIDFKKISKNLPHFLWARDAFLFTKRRGEGANIHSHPLF